MKKTLALLASRWWLWFGLVLLFSTPALADGFMKFARWPAMAPNGKQIAFSWQGDLWVSPLNGMQPQRLTVHVGYDRHATWSPDGRMIAFSSRRHGNYDLFVVNASGGAVKRLTVHSGHDWPVGWSRDGKRVFFLSTRFYSKQQRTQLFSVSVEGGTPVQELGLAIAGASFSPDGKQMAFVRGNRRWWRKRSKNPNLRHIWLYNFDNKKFRRLTGDKFTADFPSWVDNSTLVFRSEKSGRFNLWKLDLKTKKQTQLTRFRKRSSGIRALSASPNTSWVAFEQWNRLHLYNLKTRQTKELKFRSTGDLQTNNTRFKAYRKGVSEYALSRRKEFAFVLKGRAFVKGVKSASMWAKALSPGSWRARELSWSPDGKTLAFATDACGYTCIYLAKAGKRKKRSLKLSSTPIPEVKPWAKNPNRLKHDESNPKFSPNGKWLAYVKGAGTLVISDLNRKKRRVLVKGWNLGDYHWSPRGRWIVFTRMDDNSNTDVYLVSTRRRGRIYNLSRHPDSDFNPVWSANGRVLAYLSRDVNNRNLINYVFLRKSDHEKTGVELKKSFRFWAKRWKMMQLRKRKARLRALRAKRTGQKDKKAKKVKRKRRRRARRKRRRRGGLRGLAFRIRRISVPGLRGASELAVNAIGSAYYVAVRGRNHGGLYKVSWRGKARKLVRGYVKGIRVLSKGRVVYLNKAGMLMMLSMRSKRPRPLMFLAPYKHNKRLERFQKFNEAWALVRRWFYDKKFHGVNWNRTHKRYKELISAVGNDQDFDDVVNLLVGELNASHMGMYTPYRGQRTKTGDIGLRFDKSYNGEGLKISFVRAKGPARRLRSRLNVGDVILKVGGIKLTKKTNFYSFLNWHIGRPLHLTVKGKGGERLVTIRPTSRRKAAVQRYKNWVRRRRRMVRRWSRGMLGYAHIYSMGMSSLAKFERDLFAHGYKKKGLLLDVRNNGGGWTTDRVLTMFRPRPHAFTRWRGGGKGYPNFRRTYYYWGKPVTLLCNEKSFSNAEIFTHAFRNLKLGKVVGMPTGGGVISTRWMRLQDGSYFGVPLRGWWTVPGKVNMENNAAQPHYRVPLSPSDELNGKDPQLFKAVRVLLKELLKKSRK